MRLFLNIFIITITCCTLPVQAPNGFAANNDGPVLPYPESLLEDLKSKDEAARLSAIQAIKPYREVQSIPILLAMVLEEPNSQIRLQAVGALWNRNDTRAARALEKVLVLDKDIMVRIASAGALGDVGIPSSSPIFLLNTIQSSEDSALIARCIRSLGRLRAFSASNTVSGFLSLEYPTEVRGTAAEALGLMGDDKQVDTLLETLENDPDNTVRSLAAQAVGRTGSTAPIETLIRTLLFDDSDIVRYQSAMALGLKRMTTPIYDAMIAGLRDTDKRVRFVCLKNISPRIKKDDIGAIAELLTDERKGIRELAHQVLSRRGIVMERIGDRHRLVE